MAKLSTKRTAEGMQWTDRARAGGRGSVAARAERATRAEWTAPFAGRAGEAPSDADLTPPDGDDFGGDYRQSHQAEGYGVYYDKALQAGYYAALWARIERPLLENILSPVGGPNRKCLDFACGTGRITNVAAKFFGNVVGVDISEAMLACARPPENVRLCHMDLTRGEQLDETFDVVTAFRFFLNAEESLKQDALRAIHAHLHKDGLLICNIHMNSISPAGIACRVLNWRGSRFARWRTMGIKKFTEILLDAGFSVEETIYYGYLPRPGGFMPKLCEIAIQPVEMACKAIKFPARFAESFVVIARKR